MAVGPLSQYAFSPAKDATIVITRVEGQLADGRRIDLPLRVESAGISRAEIEARIPADHRRPVIAPIRSRWVDFPAPGRAGAAAGLAGSGSDPTRGRPRGPTRLVELATWEVSA